MQLAESFNLINFELYHEGDYGYTRISKDEDNSRDSIETQKNILLDYAKNNKIDLLHVFEDDNYSGYKFDRPDFNILRELIRLGKVKRIIVKDLSRIGRHNAHTLIFLEFLRDNGVQLISVTENIDTFNQNDDMIIGIKTWYNELYVKDISKKIRANIRQKQKEGLVIVPQFGYMKDPNDPNKLIIDEDVTWIIKLIFKLYTEEGIGTRKIADYLNKQKIITPSLHKREKFNRVNAKSSDYEHLWYDTSVKRILKNDIYIGTFRCGTTQRTTIKGGRRNTDPSEHIVHENFSPPLISKDTFEFAQKLFYQRVTNNVRAKNEKIHRYAGLLECGDCGKVFVARRRTNKYIDYVCSTYHRYGKELCSTHRIKETELDKLIYEHLGLLKKQAIKNLERVDEFINDYKNKKRNYNNTIDKLKVQISQTKEEIKQYAKQLAKQLIDEDIYKELTSEAKIQLERLDKQLADVEKMQVINEQSKNGVIKSVEVMEEMLNKEAISDKDLRLLIDKIILKDTPEKDVYGTPKVSIEIHWSSPFSYHEQTPS